MALLLNCYQTLNVYGRAPDYLESIGKSFILALEDYPIAMIEKAFYSHIKESSDFPTPHCIIKQIKKTPQRAGVKTL